MKHVIAALAIIILASCSKPQVTSETKEAGPPRISRFHKLELKTGMNREEVEKQVAILLGYQNQYGPYGNNLQGGIVHYRDGDWALEIMYKAGAPAPLFINKNGQTQGFPPIDETVIEYKIERIR